MLQLRNKSPFAGSIFAAPNPDGIDTLYTIVKGSFSIRSRLEPAQPQEPITLEDKFYGEPDRSSVKEPSDFGLVKPSTDIVLTGHAYPQVGSTARQVDVRLTVGALSRTVRVFGDRVWERAAIGWSATPPATFERMPLVWERAFGGADLTAGVPAAETRNPVGTGFFAPNGGKKFEGGRLPNLEDPRSLITKPEDRPVPAAFGPICAHWEPRRSYAGTYDASWQANRAPYLPQDFNPLFFQIAPPGLICHGYLRGGEAVEVTGASITGPIRFVLPAIRVQAIYRLERGRDPQPANLDSVWIDTDRMRVTLVWRASMVCDKNIRRVREVEVNAA
jgi:hypothetical protein